MDITKHHHNLIWALFGSITVFLFVFFLKFPAISFGGDIVEYFGMTGSLLAHQSVALTPQDKEALELYLHPGYFMPSHPEQNGGFLYYLAGKDGNMYPVHFFFYSLLVSIVRFILELSGQNPLLSLRITNVILFSVVSFIVLKYFLSSFFQRITFLSVWYLSPVVSFLIWPGPDMYYMSLLLLGIFLFFKNHYFLAALTITLASWHSQPLAVLALAATFMFGFHAKGTSRLLIPLVLLILFLPYVYNYFVFGVLTPWTILSDGWTQLYGFGPHNMSLQKFLEQLFDANIGLLWYAPFLLIGGFYFGIKSAFKNITMLCVLLLMILTAFLYQTNPAWHYGTAGFGPTRHILFLLPFLCYAVVSSLKPNRKHLGFLYLGLVVGLNMLFLNGFLTPRFENSLFHSPFAQLLLKHAPSFYNPTPEIFVDRTNHTDLKYLHTAVYMVDGVCKKAYVLTGDSESVKKKCGEQSAGYLPDNEFDRKASYYREIRTTYAQLIPDSFSCGIGFEKSKEKPFVCLQSEDAVVKETKVTDRSRIQPRFDITGAWTITLGDPVTIVVPPGYILDYQSTEGVYVNF